MHDNREGEQNRTGLTGKATGMQGIDKAPGEEPASAPDHFVQDTQKGKNKVDGDPSKESDRPIEQP